jgi:Fe-S cluster assembly scaffold protein SufB
MDRFVYIPEGVKCPMETYLPILESMHQRQDSLKELLIIADKGSYVSYLRRMHCANER